MPSSSIVVGFHASGSGTAASSRSIVAWSRLSCWKAGSLRDRSASIKWVPECCVRRATSARQDACASSHRDQRRWIGTRFAVGERELIRPTVDRNPARALECRGQAEDGTAIPPSLTQAVHRTDANAIPAAAAASDVSPSGSRVEWWFDRRGTPSRCWRARGELLRIASKGHCGVSPRGSLLRSVQRGVCRSPRSMGQRPVARRVASGDGRTECRRL